MNVTVNTALLAKKLKLVEKIIAQKSIIPIYSNVRLSAEMNELTLSTTNLEISMMTTCPVVTNEVGMITAPVKPLLDLINQVTEEHTHLVLEKKHVRIAAGSFKMRLQTLSAEDFPQLPQLPTGGMLVPGDVFKTMIRRVRYAISDADKRYFMNGALLSMTDNLIALVATDGKRLSLTATKRTVPGAAVDVVIPTKTLDVLLSDEAHEDILFNKDARQLFFVSDENVLTSRTVDGKFPNYQRVIPKENAHVVKIQRLQMLAALKRVALAASDSRAVTFLIADHSVSMSASNQQVGDAVEHLTVVYDGPEIKIAFEWNFVEDFLTAASGQTIDLKLKDAQTASLWQDGAEFMNVIMPIRA